ncbi:MAG: Eco57I restriction-modification methylase domain-containing protein [Bacteroidales bacterium]|nr:Eco57I restriction-modification methylase domain-containing protein [Bacteroidales bacterium]
MLFQKNILKKYLATLAPENVERAWEIYKSYFLNSEIQYNIRQSKEEQFQEGFLRELFVKVLGYTLNPSPDYNLITEQKNETNSKKADGAILQDGKVIGIIELKDHKITDLAKVEPQVFNYKSQHPDARLVIISNFEKLRLYIDNAVEHIEWNLFHLTEQDFREMYLCLAWPQVEHGVACTIKQESVSTEDQITKALYKDYSQFKRAIFADIIKNNPAKEGTDEKEWKLLLFKKTQKLLDRLLFIFFAEDGGLLPPNLMMRIIEQWEKLKELDEYQPFYDRVKKYFGYLDTGHKFPKYELFAYNGGLFKPDEVLDNIVISDEPLVEHTRRFSTYDFESEVDVNILGHIFENSLSEIEEVGQQINNGDAMPTSKRKQDGVFYTPQYITKYIVENTVGRLCAEKKNELGIVEEEYFADKNRQKQTKIDLLKQLNHYREWLLQLTILDPACGSGAFLNAALQFLMNEHALIDEMEAKLTGASIVLQGIENSILENNLYGVDINEESVEIAQLALWLRTAKPHRKLNTLSRNIKCGNSLISDPAIAGPKAFDWQKEFPQVFEKGGFDVVIGNPPYVQLQSLGTMSDAYAQCGFETYNKSADLYCLFTEKGYNLLKQGGLQSFIMPNKWMLVAYGKELRKFMAKTNMQQIINFGDVQFFDEATIYVCIFVTKKSCERSNELMALSLNQKTYHGDFLHEVPEQLANYPSETFGEKEWIIQPKAHFNILQKMQKGVALKDMPISIYRGILTGYNDAFFIDETTKDRLAAEDPKSAELIKPLLRGRDIQAWMPEWDDLYLIGTLPILQLDIDNYPAIKEHLLSFGKDRLEQSGAKGARKKTSNKWFETQDTISYYEEFSKPKIMYPNMTSLFPFVYDEKGFFGNDKTFMITANDNSVNLKFLTAIFNSKLCKLWIWYNCPELQGGTREIRKVYFENFQIPLDVDQKILGDLTDLQMQHISQLQEKRNRFLRRLSENMEGVKITTTLQTFDQMDFTGFVSELKKQKIKLSLPQQDEWEDYFRQYTDACHQLSDQIAATDREIDLRVYHLYGLTYDEVLIVDPNTPINREDYEANKTN